MITSTYCAIIALIFITLSINVINGRRKFDSPLGDSSNFEMLRRIRAQSNLAEYSPIFIILLTFAEYQGLRSLAVHFFGIIFKGHPNLKRILNMDEMDYFPMRKEFPLEDQTRIDKDDEMFGR